MMDDSDARALTALRRFGLDARPGDLARVKSDPRGVLIEDIERTKDALIDVEGLPTSHDALVQYRNVIRALKDLGEQATIRKAKILRAES